MSHVQGWSMLRAAASKTGWGATKLDPRRAVRRPPGSTTARQRPPSSGASAMIHGPSSTGSVLHGGVFFDAVLHAPSPLRLAALPRPPLLHIGLPHVSKPPPDSIHAATAGRLHRGQRGHSPRSTLSSPPLVHPRRRLSAPRPGANQRAPSAPARQHASIPGPPHAPSRTHAQCTHTHKHTGNGGLSTLAVQQPRGTTTTGLQRRPCGPSVSAVARMHMHTALAGHSQRPAATGIIISPPPARRLQPAVSRPSARRVRARRGLLVRPLCPPPARLAVHGNTNTAAGCPPPRRPRVASWGCAVGNAAAAAVSGRPGRAPKHKHKP
ncbi:hypothetical protein BDV95DRAFT_594381 [Massariosphaeria phaeospora]|uniref:Uncharacterized protein n=1 Tax=Massariosphaeria phaeospora TaxID=100035 RepID=A0A7C8I6Q9_9PLEO|nr:hypothetical protein BDV95DRAFT_594381 [Massariosphaeria phaeospora]